MRGEGKPRPAADHYDLMLVKTYIANIVNPNPHKRPASTILSDVECALVRAGLDPSRDEAWQKAGLAGGLAEREKILIAHYLREAQEEADKLRGISGEFREQAMAQLSAELTKKIFAITPPEPLCLFDVRGRNYGRP